MIAGPSTFISSSITFNFADEANDTVDSGRHFSHSDRFLRSAVMSPAAWLSKSNRRQPPGANSPWAQRVGADPIREVPRRQGVRAAAGATAPGRREHPDRQRRPFEPSGSNSEIPIQGLGKESDLGPRYADAPRRAPIRRDGATWRTIGLIPPICTGTNFRTGGADCGPSFRTTDSNDLDFLVAICRFPSYQAITAAIPFSITWLARCRPQASRLRPDSQSHAAIQ